MTTMTATGLARPRAEVRTSPAATAPASPSLTRSTVDLLQSNIAAPDRSYWTAYDHYMVEREARALRRAYAYSLLAKAWNKLRQRVAGR